MSLSCILKFCFLFPLDITCKDHCLFLSTHTHKHIKKGILFHYYFLSFLFLLQLWVQLGKEGVGKGTRWEEWDGMEGEEGSVCAWGDVVSSREAVPVREITMVVICAIKKEGNTAEGMSLHSCEGLLITPPPRKPTPPSPVLLSTAGEQQSPCRNRHKAAVPNPATVGTGAAWAKTQTRGTCHPLPAARTFILLTFCFCMVIILFNNRIFGKGTSIAAEKKKKKKVFMNNGTFQIHLVSETFFSFLLQPII